MHATTSTITTTTTTDLTINDTITHTFIGEYKSFNSDEDVDTSLLSFFSTPSTTMSLSSESLFSDEDAQAPYSATVIKPVIARRNEPQFLQQPLEANHPGTPTILDENSQPGEADSAILEESNGNDNGSNVIVRNFQLFDVINQVHLAVFYFFFS